MVALSAEETEPEPQFPLDPHRWVQLWLLSTLALLSDWVCFATSAVPNEWMMLEGHDASELIDIFLFANVLSCFLYTDITAFFGLRKAICFASGLMAAGALLRSGIPFSVDALGGLYAGVDAMPAYLTIVVGTILVGVSQPFFQCAPPLLSQTWFGPSERSLATATAINFNQVGIATAFIVGGLMANTPLGMAHYFDAMTLCAIGASIATVFLFRERPASPPSGSAAAAWALEAEKLEEEGKQPFSLSYPRKAAALLQVPGFELALIAFVASIGTTNVVSAFTAPELARAGFAPGVGVDLAGAGFQFAIVAGGIVLGRFVDQTKQFKQVMLSCLLASIAMLAALGVAEGYDQSFATWAVTGLLFSLGFVAGPVQPIAAELAVEVAYPCDENAVEATQQLSGNLFSALLVPICQGAASFDLQFPGKAVDMRGDTIILLALVGLVAAGFSSFDAPLVRTLVDDAEAVAATTPVE